MRVFDKESIIELIKWIQIKNHKAYESHRKKKMEIEEAMRLE